MNRNLTVALIASSVMLGVSGASAQTWTPLKNTPNIGAYNPTLLTDGSVMVQDADNDVWYKLTPDNKGSYQNGTWKQLASTPGYGPLYYASSVLPDGRVFTMGGEYNFGVNDWQNQGFIYDPVKDSWTQINAPSAWTQMGDTGSIMLPQGKLLIADPLSNQCVLFDPTSNTFSNTFTNGKADGNDEEGLVMLPNGNVLTVDAVKTPNSEIFNTKSLTWSSAGSTINNLVQASTEELGPMVLRPDGTVICFGGSQHNSIYNTKTATWSAGPDFPSVSGGQLDCADAPACLLPSGNVICCTSPGFAQSGQVFFEWDGTSLNQVTGTPTASGDTSFTGSFLTLPTGELMFTNQSPSIYLYTSKGSANASWYPTITAAPSSVATGTSYVISGTQLTGMSGASAYGDDQQNFTNYALVRITNNKTGHVFYCKTFNPSTYAVQTGSTVTSTNFKVPNGIEQGASTIQVVTNGLASKSVNIVVGPPVTASSVSVYQGKYVSGQVSDIKSIDGSVYVAQSISTAAGQTVSIEADFNLLNSNITSISVTAVGTAPAGVTGQVYLYDNVAKTFVVTGAASLSGTSTTLTGSGSGDITRFVGPNGLVRAIFRAIVPTRISPAPFKLSADLIQVNA